MKTLKETVEDLKQKVNCIMCMEWEDAERAAILTAIDDTFEECLKIEEYGQQLSEKLSIYCGIPYSVGELKDTSEEMAQYRKLFGQRLIQKKGVVKINED